MGKKGKVVILGTGHQAPYGIGEIIDIIPLAHSRKIEAEMRKWYNPPALHLIGDKVNRSDAAFVEAGMVAGKGGWTRPSRPAR